MTVIFFSILQLQDHWVLVFDHIYRVNERDMDAILYGTLCNTISQSSQISNTRHNHWVLVFDHMSRVNERNMGAILYGTLWNTISKSSQISNYYNQILQRTFRCSCVFFVIQSIFNRVILS